MIRGPLDLTRKEKKLLATKKRKGLIFKGMYFHDESRARYLLFYKNGRQQPVSLANYREPKRLRCHGERR